jgi:hypothetical protein
MQGTHWPELWPVDWYELEGEMAMFFLQGGAATPLYALNAFCKSSTHERVSQ